ncbi:phosphotransferase enzyme family protein [Westerdykella ornata]|uniref:Phosphotransferase enzyme family protein n=1 Tax=Westerdykella ornata TaxID=318751 RepID=A0A6A6JZA3_WESOR|nr:phosphotransferase enzyme family protein [Westerdykella ornata]KAF2280389.1 phosphotransferase enzyme family protein [Westerdykella ornata]
MTAIAALQAAAMPELYDSMPADPKINVLYVAPGHDIISPEQVEASKLKVITVGAGTQLAKISPSMLVKYGSHASLIEAKTMSFVRERTSIPVPRLYAAYAYGPLDRDVDDFGSVYDTYIFMEFIEGEDLEKSWGRYNTIEKQQLSVDLKKYLAELRSIPPANYIGSVNGGPVTDIILEWSTTSRGPFNSEEDFNATIADTFVAKSKGHVGPYIRGMLDSHKHSIVFTHGDLRPANIIVKDGRVAAIIDWEMAGWYPEYWEFAKAFYLEAFSTDWANHLLDILTPYHCEELMHSKLMSVLW